MEPSMNGDEHLVQKAQRAICRQSRSCTRALRQREFPIKSMIGVHRTSPPRIR